MPQAYPSALGGLRQGIETGLKYGLMQKEYEEKKAVRAEATAEKSRLLERQAEQDKIKRDNDSGRQL